MNQELLSVEEAARILGIKPSIIRMWIFQRRLRKVKLGRSVRIPSDFIEDLTKSNTHFKKPGRRHPMGNKTTPSEKVAEREKRGGLNQQWFKTESRCLWLDRFMYKGVYYRTKPYLTKTEAKDALNRHRLEVRENRRRFTNSLRRPLRSIVRVAMTSFSLVSRTQGGSI
ncbi:MAG: helix-turn-helix domain-containing protein [Acidobacteria bacterium]|nr:helix-turn-helix domain-containing protein [Acidobacteriota bacterium]MBI3657428.1 helix-turn-helix domain-containing protein [Acidobacteriota bacterium]